MIELTKKELATELHVAVGTVDSWQRDGMKYHRVGRNNMYRIKEVFDFLMTRSNSKRLDPAQERARLHKSQRQIKQRELEILNGEYARLADIEDAWGTLVGAARAKMLSLPKKIAPAVMSATTMSEVEEEARLLVYEALTELAA